LDDLLLIGKTLVYRLLNPLGFVAFKMGRRLKTSRSRRASTKLEQKMPPIAPEPQVEATVYNLNHTGLMYPLFGRLARENHAL